MEKEYKLTLRGFSEPITPDVDKAVLELIRDGLSAVAYDIGAASEAEITIDVETIEKPEEESDPFVGSRGDPKV